MQCFTFFAVRVSNIHNNIDPCFFALSWADNFRKPVEAVLHLASLSFFSSISSVAAPICFLNVIAQIVWKHPVRNIVWAVGSC